MTKTKTRCRWADSHELHAAYHDAEWGRPVHDDRLLFEMLCLEGQQAGLSWLTILKKRHSYREAFANFDAKIVAKFDARKKASLLKDADIVRHDLKINAIVENAKAVLAITDEFGSFDAYIWRFVSGKTLLGGGTNQPNPESAAMSEDLKKRGFRFVGQTTCFAFMQAVGMVDDHASTCFRAKR